jgi:hypothetical protein
MPRNPIAVSLCTPVALFPFSLRQLPEHILERCRLLLQG